MSDTSSWVLDVKHLSDALDIVARHRNLSDRGLAAETGLSSSTITRIGQGQKPDADALVTLLMWLNIDVATFACKRGEAP